MPEIAVCPKCQARYRTGGVKAGRRLRCRKCRTIFTVQDAAPADTLQVPLPDDAALPAAIGDKSSLLRAQMSASIAPSLAPSADEEKYTVEDEIARGGMGAVLRAADRDLGREVAMKVMLDAMDEQGRARFVEEARLTGQLEHPNIVPVHELGIDAEGRLFFTMKLVKGKSLAEVLKGLRENAPGEFTLGRLLNIFVNVCNAMAFAHSKGIIHRDLKPANLMMGDFGEVLVMDWGLAKVVGREELPAAAAPARARGPGTPKTSRFETSAEKTMEGAILGTPFYMPPEQARGDIAKLDARSDIYSLGAILYEILTLKPPVEGATLPAILRNVVEGNISTPEARTPDRPMAPELSAVAMKALAKRPEDRYATAGSLRRDIELYAEGRAVSAKPDTTWETLLKLVRRNRGASVATGLAAVLLLTLGGISFVVNLRARQRAEENARTAESQKARADAERQNAEKALADFRTEQAERVKLQRMAAPALTQKARSAIDRKDFDSALRDLETAIGLDPDAADARMLKGETLLVTRRYGDAIREFHEALKRRPGDPHIVRFAQFGEALSKAQNLNLIKKLAEFFASRNEHSLAAVEFSAAESLAKSRENIYAMHRDRFRAALGGRCSIGLDAEGRILVDLQSEGPEDISFLKGIPVYSLNLNRSAVADLTPLQGMPLEVLDVSGTKITDLRPIQKCPLVELYLVGLKIADLDLLRGLPLKKLSIQQCTRIASLKPLEGMQLEWLGIGSVPVTDLSPLRNMPLHTLVMEGVPASELSPLSGMPLKHLDLAWTRVSDLSPIRSMPLELLDVSSVAQFEDLSVLKGMPLKTLRIGGIGAKDFEPLKEFRLVHLNASWTHISDLGVLIDMKLESVDLGNTSVANLAPLRGMPIKKLALDNTRVVDLMPLSGMPLVELSIPGTKVIDLTPLTGMGLETIKLSPSRILQGMDVVRKMKSIRVIWSDKGHHKPEDFWRMWDAGEFK